MENHYHTISLLNTLIKTNIDRIKGYEMAAQETEAIYQAELKSVFYKMADESVRFKNALSQEVIRLGGIPSTESTAGGEIYRVWMRLKTSFIDGSTSALHSAEFGERVAAQIYRKVLKKAEASTQTIELIENQFKSLQASRSLIKRYCDEYFAKTELALTNIVIG